MQVSGQAMEGGVSTCGRVAILLATYNGEKYLDEQMCSLFAQSYSDFVVIARDDSSSDDTRQILERWQTANPGKVIVVSDDKGNLGVNGSFSLLMAFCDAPYFAFCDQDDVWLPNRLELAMKEIRLLEEKLEAYTPILIHSDLRVVDSGLREISPSFFEYSQMTISTDGRIDRLIFNNIVTGCASLGNRALLDLAMPIPKEFPYYHDWWLGLVAASCGTLRTLSEPTLLYRQHEKNQVGAGHRQRSSTLWAARHVLQQPRLLISRMTEAARLLQSHADILLRRAGDKMPRRNREFLRAFCLPLRKQELAALPWPQRMQQYVRWWLIWTRRFPLLLRWCY